MPKPPKPSSPFDPMLRKKQILDDLGIYGSTLDQWIKKGHFPEPTVLNAPIGGREIIGWPQSVYLQWRASLPVRQAQPITQRAYDKVRRKGKPVIRRPE